MSLGSGSSKMSTLADIALVFFMAVFLVLWSSYLNLGLSELEKIFLTGLAAMNFFSIALVDAERAFQREKRRIDRL